MRFSFNEAFDALQKGYSSAVRSVRDRVLPTPGKRKRDEQEESVDTRSSMRQRIERDQADELPRLDSLEPTSQFAKAVRAPPDLSRTTSTAANPQSLASPRTLFEGPSPAAGLGAAHESRQNAWPSVSKPAGGTNPRRWFRNPQPKSQTTFQRPRSAMGANHLLPWQRKFASQIQQRGAFSFAAAVRSSDDAEHAWQWTQSRPFAAQSIARDISPQQDLQERDALRRMTQATMAHRPLFQSRRQDSGVVDLESFPSQSHASASGPHERSLADARDTSGEDAVLGADKSQDLASYRSLLQPARAPEPIPVLAMSRFELEKQADARLQEEKRKALREATDRCNQLMGDRQAELLARARRVLGETSTPRNPASEISKASMQVAQREAEMLKGALPEIALLEEEQEKFAKNRKVRAAAHQEALSVAKTARPTQFWADQRRSPLRERNNTNGVASHKSAASEASAKKAVQVTKNQKAAPKQDDIVEILSSDDDEQAPDQVGSEEEQETDGSGSEEDEADEETELSDRADDDDEGALSKRFRSILVDDRRITPQFPRLTKKQFKLYTDALNESADQESELFLHKASNIGVTRQLMACLKPRTWLNDEVINLMMGLLQERDKIWRLNGKEYPKCHFHNTFFFNKLYLDKRKYDYSQVARWTLKKKLKMTPQLSESILDCDRVIAPVHLGCHWTCAVADLTNQEFIYLDSMLDRNEEVMQSFSKYIADEYQDKRKEEVDTSSWPIRYRQDIPRQMNGFDCGIFAVMFAEHLSRDAPLEFSQSDMEYFRVMIAAAIMEQKVLAEFD